MSFVTPIDGQPAIAEHVAQITETLSGLRAEPLTLAAPLTLDQTADVAWIEMRYAAIDSYARMFLATDGIKWGEGDASPATGFHYYGPGDMRVQGHLNPSTTNTNDLGTAVLRWRNLWATDADLSGALAIGTTPATSGAVRLANAASIAWRNAANDDNVTLGVSSSDQWLFTTPTNPSLGLRRAGESNNRGQYAVNGIQLGPGSTAPDVLLLRGGVGLWNVTGTFQPQGTNAYDLGATALRWRKLWAQDADFTNPPTVGGVPIGGISQATADARYLQLTGGTVSGAVYIDVGVTPGSSALQLSQNLETFYGGKAHWYSTTNAASGGWGYHATQPGLRYFYNGSGQVTYFDTVGRLRSHDVVPVANNAHDSGSSANRWLNLYTGGVNATGDVAGQHLVSQGADAGFFLKDRNTANQYIFTSVNDQLNWYSSKSGTNQFMMKDGNVGVGVTPSWATTTRKVIQLGQGAAVAGMTTGLDLELLSNTVIDASQSRRAIVNGSGAFIWLHDGTLELYCAPYVAAGATQAYTVRASLNEYGLYLAPSAGSAAININGTAQPKITVASSAPSSPMTGDLWVW